jgi:prophage antirepressor-like protein
VNEVTTYTTPITQGGQNVRVVTIDGDPWFVAVDVCRVLGMNVDKGIAHHLDRLRADERTLRTVEGARTGPATLISESGLTGWSSAPSAIAPKLPASRTG